MLCQNYRGITLLSVVAKVYERILERKLRTHTEPLLSDSQSGFRKGHSIQDQIFTVKTVINKTLRQGNECIMAFIDLEKAFDRVARNKVWTALENIGVQRELIEAIKSMYNNSRCYIRTKNMASKLFEVPDGLRQGGVLSPVLFIITMNEIIQKSREGAKALRIGYKNMKPVEITECAFADDLVIFAKKEEELQRNINVWKENLGEYNLKINISKSKVMMISRSSRNIKIQIDNIQMEQVEDFKYLGTVIEAKGNNNLEVDSRIDSALKVYHSLRTSVINKKEISRKTKLTVYKTILRPVLMFACESWVLSQQNESRLQALEMKYLRRVLGVTRMDRLRNDYIRKELEVESILELINKRKLQWFGHLARMNSERQVRKVWEAGITEKRERGRPPENWYSATSKLLKKKGLTWQEGKKLATNKKEWRKIVHEAE